MTRQNDLARLVRLAAELRRGKLRRVRRLPRGALRQRRAGEACTCSRITGAKGLEFEVVFLPRLEERELPSKLSKTADALAEERRLLYVGLTRAKRHLTVTWSGKPSRFLAELQIEDEWPKPKPVEPDDPLYEVLKRWRLETAKAPGATRVRDLPQLDAGRDRPPRPAQPRRSSLPCPASVPAKLERYGDEVLAVLAAGA